MISAKSKRATLRLTAAQLAKKGPAEPGLGTRLWQATNEVRFGSPVVGISGRYGDEVYHQRGTKCFVRRYGTPRLPESPKQQEQQSRMQDVMPAWTALPAEVRKAWQDYSLQHFGREQYGKKTGNLGQNLFTSAQLYRLAWGDGMSAAEPATAPPPCPIQMRELSAPEGQMAWRVEHAVKLPAGYRLEVRMTPAAKEGRRPRRCRLVRAGQTTAESFFSLGESGTIYLLPQPVHAVAPGQRYGLQIRLITPDGVAGRPLYMELERRETGEVPSGGGVDGVDPVDPVDKKTGGDSLLISTSSTQSTWSTPFTKRMRFIAPTPLPQANRSAPKLCY